jgi:hypothetical protein
MAVVLIDFASVVSHRLPAQVTTIDIVADAKHLVQGRVVQGRDQLEQLPKALAQISLR